MVLSYRVNLALGSLLVVVLLSSVGSAQQQQQPGATNAPPGAPLPTTGAMNAPPTTMQPQPPQAGVTTVSPGGAQATAATTQAPPAVTAPTTQAPGAPAAITQVPGTTVATTGTHQPRSANLPTSSGETANTTGLGSEFAEAVMKTYINKSCSPILQLADNQTRFFFMEQHIKYSKFADLCPISLLSLNVSAMTCNVLYSTAIDSAIECNTTGVFPRSGNTGSFPSVWRTGWDLESRNLTYLDATIVDYQVFLEIYLTRAEKNFMKLARGIWDTGFQSPQALNISSNVTVSIPNLFSQPVMVLGSDALAQAQQNLSKELQGVDVLSYEFVFGNQSTCTVRAKVVFVPTMAPRLLRRTLWITTTFDDFGNLTSVEIEANKPLIFWDLEPIAGLSQAQSQSEASSSGGVSSGSLISESSYGDYEPEGNWEGQDHEEAYRSFEGSSSQPARRSFSRPILVRGRQQQGQGQSHQGQNQGQQQQQQQNSSTGGQTEPQRATTAAGGAQQQPTQATVAQAAQQPTQPRQASPSPAVGSGSL